MTTGLVLSGGGTRGVAHLGVLQALDELGIRPSIISGTSSGALLGALYSAGNSPKKILKMVKEHSSSSLIKMILSPGGLFSVSGLTEILKSGGVGEDFEKLLVPLFVTATDINGGNPVTFSKGPLYNVLIGAASIPALFTPVKCGDQYLVDGGVMNNFPVECIRDKCDRIIGSYVNKIYPEKAKKLTRMQILDRCFHMAVAHKVAEQAQYCDVLLEPDLSRYSMFEMTHADKMFKIGYKTAMENISSIVAVIPEAI
ncbi:MAG TPA: patatin-like phospholipase family protein [Mucilaginibacter sp.]|jgi:NTE family protein|nr:patatin-like phospholipase family protein [Mucilaginibacter sp.]